MSCLHLPAVLDNLHEFQAYVLGRAQALGAPLDVRGKLEFVVEEIVVNVINHAYDQTAGDLDITCMSEFRGVGEQFCVVFTDWGPPFDPQSRQTPDTSAGVKDRVVGGLGIFLAAQMADDIRYDRKGKTNVLTICFELPLKQDSK